MVKTFSKSLIAISALCLVFLSSCQRTNETEPVRTITVTGKGSVYEKPDQITLKFTITTREWNVVTAVEGNAEKTAKILEAVKATGIDEKDISTHDYSITQETDRVNGRNYPGRYNTSNTLSILVRNIDNAGPVIDAVVANGDGTTLSSFEYSLSDTTTAMRQARTQAVQNALDAASLLAGASGNKVGNVIDMREEFTYSRLESGRANFSLADTDSTASTKISAANMEIATSVTVTYSLQ